MFGNRVGRAAPILNRVAFFTAIPEWRGGKLVIVRVLMAIGAECELRFINRILAGRNVAFCAIHLDVFAF